MVAYVFDSDCKYDIIVGRDWLDANKFDIRFSAPPWNGFNVLFQCASLLPFVPVPFTTAITNPMNQTTTTVRVAIAIAHGDILRVLTNNRIPQNMANAAAILDESIAMASHALRCSIHSTLGVSPGAAVFNRDMLLDVPYVVDWLLLRDKRQVLIDNNLRRANSRRNNYDYRVGDQVFELIKGKGKDVGIAKQMQPFFQGPYLVLKVHTNGTLTIQRTPTLIDDVNIRKLRPFKQ